MKKFAIAALIVGTLAGGTLGASLPTMARDSFSFSFNTGDVAFGYSDGYWDNNRQWHRWRNSHEARQYRAQYGERYQHRKHTRQQGNGWRNGWRDQDHDGVSDRHDRDRDGDGVSNRRDDAPNNPRRN